MPGSIEGSGGEVDGASADKSIGEGVKRSSRSFNTADYFATINLGTRSVAQLLFHSGVISKDGVRDLKNPDPTGLMIFLSSDHGLVTLGEGGGIGTYRKVLVGVVEA